MDAILYDGVTADRHQVRVEAGTGDLHLFGLSAGPESIPATDLTIVDSDARRTTLGHRQRSGWRLVLAQPVAPDIAALLPKKSDYGSWIDRVGLWKASGAMAVAAGAVLLIGYTAPTWMAPLVPESWERNLGAALVGDFGDNACHSSTADAALKKMAARVDPAAGSAASIPMTVIDVGIFNAAAIPGNRIVIFKGALDDTDNPDAMAGILAHEIGHVRKRHVTQALIRELGIGALIRLFAGDIGANAQQLVSLSYTRANEEEADQEAIKALDNGNIDPRPTAALFRDLEKLSGPLDSVKWLNSHPQSGDRAKLFDASWKKGRIYQTSLTQADYQALQNACGSRPEKEVLAP
nr:M48 family metallopeptidase [uncultured Sphingomonas sp.]